MRFAVAIFILVFSLGSASAQPKWAAGVGVSQCSHFRPVEFAFFSWAQGFMTAVNVARKHDQKPQLNLLGKSPEEQEAFIKSFCEERPQSDYGNAVIELMKTLPILLPDAQPMKRGARKLS